MSAQLGDRIWPDGSFWRKADIVAGSLDVRLWPEADFAGSWASGS